MSRKKERKARSLRAQMLVLILFCWLLPMLMVLSGVSYYVYEDYNRRISEEMTLSLETGLRLSSDRLDSAVVSLRRTAYDGVIRDSWDNWRSGNTGWVSLYSNTVSYFMTQYQGDSRFPLIAFWFAADPQSMRVGTYIQEAGGSFQRLNSFWADDYEGAMKLAETLDTYVGIYENSGRIYLVRNLTSRFELIGTQAMELSPDSFFEGLRQASLGHSLTVWIGDRPVIIGEGSVDTSAVGITPGQLKKAQGTSPGGGRYLYNYIEGDGYVLSAAINIDAHSLFSEMRGYIIILLFMLVLLVPMLIIYYRYYERNITRPVNNLIDGARRMGRGEFGYTIDEPPRNEELRFITDSFNNVSGTLDSVFEQIYHKELSLRDAKIKALQSQINPHFLNNTLEIINWEARLGETAKVSQMIEALSTLLDATIDREVRPEVRFSEELRYIKAYILIIDHRFGKRLTITQSIAPNTYECKVPRLILQPIVENAVEHGMTPGGHGQIDIRAFLEDGNLVIEVENNGELSPADSERIERLLSPDYDASKEPAYSLGIANVNSRLRILYGPPSGLSIYKDEDAGVIARMLIAQNQPQEDAPQEPEA